MLANKITKLFNETIELNDLCMIWNNLYSEDKSEDSAGCWPIVRISQLTERLKTSVMLKTKDGLIVFGRN